MVGSIGYQSSPCTIHLWYTDQQIVKLYSDDIFWGKDEKAGSLLALAWAEFRSVFVEYVKNRCSKANALRTIVASAVCICYLGLNTPDNSGSHMSKE